jgi:DNA-binding MarR family transcriptional regulator
VYLTLADQEIYDSIVESGRLILAQIVAGISNAEQKQLTKLLLRVKANTALILDAEAAA